VTSDAVPTKNAGTVAMTPGSRAVAAAGCPRWPQRQTENEKRKKKSNWGFELGGKKKQ
jgi:hypothetical protein